MWQPVDRPVVPIAPICCPRITRSPALTEMADWWLYVVRKV